MRALLSGTTVLLLACSTSAVDGAGSASDDGEPVDEAALTADQARVDSPDETASGTSEFVPLRLGAGDALIDVRGVGDSAFAATHESPPRAAGFGAALDAFDSNGAAYRGDLSFINFETVLGDGCESFAKPYIPGQSYAFISRPDNLKQAILHGFNLIGFANNHTRDCNRTNAGISGVDSTLRVATQATADARALWSGVSADAAKRSPSIGSFSIKGREVKVAFASVYLGVDSGSQIPCAADAEALMKAMKDADVDLRILALHSVDESNQAALAKLGAAFVETWGGDVVYGSGPHVWRPARVLRKPNGSTGVVFESVGNFLHPGLATQTKNYVGRALFDVESLALRQVQLVAITNRGAALEASSEAPQAVPANLHWNSTTVDGLRVAYAGVRP